MPKSWRRSKTLAFNAIVGALAVAETQLHVLQPLLGANVYQLATFTLAVGNAVLRIVTTQPLTTRAPGA